MTERWELSLFCSLSVLVLCVLPKTTPIEVALRLGAGFFLVLVGPGWLLLDRVRWFSERDDSTDRLLLRFAASYLGVAFIGIAAATVHASLVQAVTVCLALSALGAIASFIQARSTPSGGRRSRYPFYLLGLCIFIFVVGWQLEVPIAGEELVELITVRKFLTTPQISFTNLMHTPEALWIYLFPQYYFCVALIAKLTGLSHYVVYVKLRSFYAVLAFLAFFSFARFLLRSLAFGLLAAAALAAIVIVRPVPFSEIGSLFPMIHRGSFGPGVLNPILFLITWKCIFDERNIKKKWDWRWMAPALFLIGVLLTHIWEGFSYAAFFLPATVGTVLLVPSLRKFSRPAFGVAGTSMLVIGLYLVIHRYVEKDVHWYLQNFEMTAIPDTVRNLLRSPKHAFFGDMYEWAQGLMTRHLMKSPAFFIFTLPLLILPWTLVSAPAAGVFFCLALWVPVALYTMPLGFLVLLKAVGTNSSHTYGFFTFIGTLAFLSSLYYLLLPLNRWITQYAGLKRMAFLLGAAVGVYGLSKRVIVPLGLEAIDLVDRWPKTPFYLGAASLLVAYLFRRRAQTKTEPTTGVVGISFAVLLLSLLVPLYKDMRVPEDSGDLLSLLESDKRPSVLSWNEYYPVLQSTSNPRIDLPWPIVQDLKSLMQDNQTVLYDPERAYTIPFLMNQYIAVCASHGGLFTNLFRGEQLYVRKYAGQDVHPIFNTSATLSPLESEFLGEFKIRYILANPTHYDALKLKLGAFPDRFNVLYDKGRFALYEVRGVNGI